MYKRQILYHTPPAKPGAYQFLVIPVFNAAGQLMRVKIQLAEPGERRPKYIPIPQAEKNTAPLVFQNKGVRAWQVVESELDGLLLM